VVEAIGRWGTRWIGELGDQDLDPQLLLWDMHRNINHPLVPPGRTVIHFRFTEPAVNIRYWWLIITPDDADVCDSDPGHPVTVTSDHSTENDDRDLARRPQLVPSPLRRDAEGGRLHSGQAVRPELVQALRLRRCAPSLPDATSAPTAANRPNPPSWASRTAAWTNSPGHAYSACSPVRVSDRCSGRAQNARDPEPAVFAADRGERSAAQIAD
jgi:hypothetical protein